MAQALLAFSMASGAKCPMSSNAANTFVSVPGVRHVVIATPVILSKADTKPNYQQTKNKSKASSTIGTRRGIFHRATGKINKYTSYIICINV